MPENIDIPNESDTAIEQFSDIKLNQFNPDNFPESYKKNSDKEKQVLVYAENFLRQYVHLYRHRRLLMLNPLNECNVEKFVCSTIKPTNLSYTNMGIWSGISKYVADYLNFVPLKPPYELPKSILSPTTVLRWQKGNCFEYSSILCSLLLGAGYDAYIVSGYSSKETCLMDETRKECPFLKQYIEEKAETPKKVVKKYAVKPPRTFESKFELMLIKRKIQKEQEEKERQIQEGEDRINELHKPVKDDIFGRRVHSWILVLAGKREIPESFFIEPFSGLPYTLNDERFLGIESLWNHQNYWVNMQDCSHGIEKMNYDLTDCSQWEYMFPSNDKIQIKFTEEEDMLNDMDEDEDDEELEKCLDMPPSWIEKIQLTREEFEMQYPSGKKVIYYKKVKLEKFTPYSMGDGLVERVTIYKDIELSDLIEVREYFLHRKDKLQEKFINHETGLVSEFFRPGRLRHLKEHHYYVNQLEKGRTMKFYHKARYDGLETRIDQPNNLKESFVNGKDFLYHRSAQYGKKQKQFGPADGSNNLKPIERMFEQYHRNDEITANEDIAEIEFSYLKTKYEIKYHRDEDRITYSTREFIKPPNAGEKGAVIGFNPEMHQTYQSDPYTKPKKNVELYKLLLRIVKAEDQCLSKIRESENEILDILKDRHREEYSTELEISVYDTMRNEKYKKLRKELEELHREEKLRKQDMDLDYLAPFLSQFGNPEKLTLPQFFKLKEDCLADLKTRVVNKANVIQRSYEKQTQELSKKQAWYQQNQVSMTKDEEVEYLNFCKEAMFKISVYELRLERHKEDAPVKYKMLEKKLRDDERLKV